MLRRYENLNSCYAEFTQDLRSLRGLRKSKLYLRTLRSLRMGQFADGKAPSLLSHERSNKASLPRESVMSPKILTFLGTIEGVESKAAIKSHLP
jgi:hypothetical protein